MKYPLALAIFLLLPHALSGQTDTPTTTAIIGATVLPMNIPGTLADQTVLVRNGRIVAVGNARDVAIPKTAKRIDGRGKFLMPDLVDMHVHIPYGSEDTTSAPVVLRMFLANGVTTVLRSLLVSAN